MQTTTDTLRELETLASFEQRSAGSDAERRAALHLKGRLEELGREARIESLSTRPNWALSYTLTALLAIVGGLVAVGTPTVGAALAVAALVSAFGEVSGSFLLLRRLTGRRTSQNVVSTRSDGKPGVLVLIAHYDSGRGGSIYARRLRERLAALPRWLRPPIAPLSVVLWSITLVCASAIARAAGFEPTWLTAIQFVPTVALVAAVPVLLDIELADVVPGANDNASGVASVLELARRYDGELEHFDLCVLLTGAHEPGAQGMRAWVRRHRRELHRETTVFLSLDEVGAGGLRYTRAEGLPFARRSHRQLLELCEQIVEDDDERRFGAAPIVTRALSDTRAARARRYPAISLRCVGPSGFAPDHLQASDTPDRIDEHALERTRAFAGELIERLDGQLGPELDAEPQPSAPERFAALRASSLLSKWR